MPWLRTLAVTAAFVVVCAVVAVLGLRRASGVGPLNNPTDFVAFYCAGRVAAHGADPYRAEPLRACERAAFMESHVPMVPHLVVPAPLPGYDLAFFALFSGVSFRVACAIWVCALVAAVGFTARMLHELTGLRPLVVCAALAGSDLYASLVPGQLVPFIVCAIVGCGYFVRRDRPAAAALCALATLAEPHLGLPVLLVLAIWLPRTRAILGIGIVALGVISLLLLGSAIDAEYAARVLPVQAATEGLEFTRQYALSAALHAAGVGAAASVALGSASYLVMLVAGLLCARRAVTAFAAPELLVFVPAAAVLIGGAYVHIAQMAAAVPLALVLCARGGALRPVALWATVAVAIPWQSIAVAPGVGEFFPARGFIDPKPLLAQVADGSRLAQDAWDAWIATTIDRDHRTLVEVVLFKLPTWAGLAGLALVVGAQLGRKRLAPR